MIFKQQKGKIKNAVLAQVLLPAVSDEMIIMHLFFRHGLLYLPLQ